MQQIYSLFAANEIFSANYAWIKGVNLRTVFFLLGRQNSSGHCCPVAFKELCKLVLFYAIQINSFKIDCVTCLIISFLCFVLFGAVFNAQGWRGNVIGSSTYSIIVFLSFLLIFKNLYFSSLFQSVHKLYHQPIFRLLICSQ